VIELTRNCKPTTPDTHRIPLDIAKQPPTAAKVEGIGRQVAELLAAFALK
jgi:hypothetical protein